MDFHFQYGVTCALDAPAGSPFPLVHPNIDHTMDFLSENGFHSIELHLLRPGEVNSEHILEACAAKGLFVSSIGTGMAYSKEGLSITSPDCEVRRRAVQRLKDQLDLADKLNCCIIIGSMRGAIAPGESFSQVEKRMVDSCKELCDYAEKGRGTIAIEAIDRIETNYLRTGEDVLQLIDLVGSDRLGVHLDTYHMNMEELSWVRPVELCGDKLFHVHVADNTRLYPGSGLIDFLPFMQALKGHHYSHTLTLECFPVPTGEEAVKLGLTHLRNVAANCK